MNGLNPENHQFNEHYNHFETEENQILHALIIDAIIKLFFIVGLAAIITGTVYIVVGWF